MFPYLASVRDWRPPTPQHRIGGLSPVAQAGPVDGHRLLDEGVHALLHRVGEVDGAEVWGRGQEHDVNLVDDVLVAVEAGVLAIPGDLDPGADLRFLDGGEVFFEPILEG